MSSLETTSVHGHESFFDSSLESTKDARPHGTIVNLTGIMDVLRALQGVGEGLRRGEDVRQVCETYFQLSETSDISNAPALFLDSRTKKMLHSAQLLEVTSIALLHFFASVGGANSTLLTHLKNLVFYLHQNFLTYIELILLRLHPSSIKNEWVTALRSTLHSQSLRHPTKPQLTSFIHQQNETIANILRGIATTLLNTQRTQSPVFVAVLHVLRTMDVFTVGKARNMVRKAAEETLSLMPPQEPEEVRMPMIVPPYLPPAATNVRYTLVLDLDETLVHFTEPEGAEGTLKVRPYCEPFLTSMSSFYEIVIFTAAVQDVISPQYADWVLNQLAGGKHISHRLYRQHTQLRGNVFLKDLNLVGRDMAKMVIVDNVAENFQMQKENGIFIRSWFDDENDHDLLDLMPLLAGTLHSELVKQQVKDVRVALHLYRDQMLRTVASKSQVHTLL